MKTLGHGQVIKHGADPARADTVRTAYIYKDREYTSDYFPAGTAHQALLDDLVKRMQVPVSAVRAYRGAELLEERELLMRGN